MIDLSIKDRNKNRCVVSFRSESEILFEKTCDIRTGDKAEFFIGDLSATESLDIEEVRTFSEFLSTIDFQSPVKWEGGENLQERILENYFFITCYYYILSENCVEDSDQKRSL